ncbi:hypothetical protein EXIGLDRAFT_729411 [Exidia glandulosa HHB12029]|uniref:BHLH domain-containing protein n=1 Tax=Exidia glandulosa HHB12029 TaxID=1314781 RepID=A0A165LIM7_EXIGL|nr:hypothetical protein EXIGLDRAFT_729411 [Exidia glandulosa HHB12029]
MMLRFGPRPSLSLSLPVVPSDILDPPTPHTPTPSYHGHGYYNHYQLPTPPYTPRPHPHHYPHPHNQMALFTPHEMHALGSFFSSFDDDPRLSSATRSLLSNSANGTVVDPDGWSMSEDDIRAAVRDAQAATARRQREDEMVNAAGGVVAERTMNELLTWPPPSKRPGVGGGEAPPAKRLRRSVGMGLHSPATTASSPSPPALAGLGASHVPNTSAFSVPAKRLAPRAGPSSEPASAPAPGGKKRAALLSPSQKKANHIQSEQKRRANIRRGYDALCAAVPALVLECAKPDAKGADKNGTTRSEGLVLGKTIDHIQDLLARQSSLRARLDAARSLRPQTASGAPPTPAWERRWDGGTGAMDEYEGEGEDDDDDE